MTSAIASKLERSHSHDIRHADIDALRPCFAPGARVLEIGGGNGFQASVVTGWGCMVDCIDIRERVLSEHVFHPVRIYDDSNIPYDDATFDILYPSSVLEPVQNPVELLLEAARVHKPGGRGNNFVPCKGRGVIILRGNQSNVPPYR